MSHRANARSDQRPRLYLLTQGVRFSCEDYRNFPDRLAQAAAQAGLDSRPLLQVEAGLSLAAYFFIFFFFLVGLLVKAALFLRKAFSRLCSRNGRSAPAAPLSEKPPAMAQPTGLLRRAAATRKHFQPPRWLLCSLCSCSALKKYCALKAVLKREYFGDSDALLAFLEDNDDWGALALLADHLARRKKGGRLFVLFRRPVGEFDLTWPGLSAACQRLERAFLRGSVIGLCAGSSLPRQYAPYLALPLLNITISPDLRQAVQLIASGRAEPRPLPKAAALLVVYPWRDLTEFAAGNSSRQLYYQRFFIESGLSVQFMAPEQRKREQNRLYLREYRHISSLYSAAVALYCRFICKDRLAGLLLREFYRVRHNRSFLLNLNAALLEQDAVLVEYPFFMATVAPYARALGLPLLGTAHDCYSLLQGRGYGLKKLARLEVQAFRQADFVAAVAPRERDYFIKKGVKAQLAPSTAETSGKIAMPRAEAETVLRQFMPNTPGKVLFFVGSGYFPNVDAAVFLHKLAERLVAINPDIGVVVAGHCAPKSMSSCNFTALGPVSDLVLDALYVRTDIFVAPILFGTGAAVKIIEAMGRGKPVFGTGISFRELDVADGRECFIEDDLGQYSSRLATLLMEPARLKQVGKNASLFAAKYDYRNALKPYVEFLHARRSRA